MSTYRESDVYDEFWLQFINFNYGTESNYLNYVGHEFQFECVFVYEIYEYMYPYGII